MKNRNLILLVVLFLFTGVIVHAQDEEQYHIKLIKMIDGKKLVLDTVLTSNKAFVWMGDTIRPDMTTTDENQKVYQYEIRSDNDGDRDVDVEKLLGTAFINLGDSSQYKIVIEEIDSVLEAELPELKEFIKSIEEEHKFLTDENCKKIHHRIPEIHDIHANYANKGNVIELSDPSIESYKKKKLKGDREKITIVRKIKPDCDKLRNIEKSEIIMMEDPDKEEKEIRVEVKTDKDGNYEVTEYEIDEDGNPKIISSKKSKVINLKELPGDTDGEIKIEVEVSDDDQ